MNALLIIRFIAFSGLLYLLYILVFKRFSFFAGNRWLLLSIPLLSFLIPLIAPSFANNVAPALSNYQLDAIILNSAATQTAETTSSFNWISMAYYSGLSVIFFLFLLGLFKAIRIKRTAELRIDNIYYSSTISSAYTFFKSIIIPLALKEYKDINTIIKHEQVHVRQWHGLDNLYYQIITAIAWFNPFIHLLAKELRQTHECLADTEAIQKTSREEYAHLLLSSAFGNELNFPLAAGTATPFFNSSLIKTRITMIYKTKTNSYFKWAYLLLIPMLAGMILYSCDKMEESKGSEETPVQTEHKDALAFSDVDQPPLFEHCDANASYDEQMACFQKGIIQYISENFEYPEKAKKAGLEGKIYVSFVINKEGLVDQVDVSKGTFSNDDNLEALDEAQAYSALLITELPKMSPAIKDGKKVAVSFTLPINMKLK